MSFTAWWNLVCRKKGEFPYLGFVDFIRIVGKQTSPRNFHVNVSVFVTHIHRVYVLYIRCVAKVDEFSEKI